MSGRHPSSGYIRASYAPWIVVIHLKYSPSWMSPSLTSQQLSHSEYTMSCTKCESPCSILPHLALLARTRRIQPQGLVNGAFAGTCNTTILGPSDLLGLDYGTIFPKSHFPPATSMKKMAAAARERALLRNAMKLVLILHCLILQSRTTSRIIVVVIDF